MGAARNLEWITAAWLHSRPTGHYAVQAQLTVVGGESPVGVPPRTPAWKSLPLWAEPVRGVERAIIGECKVGDFAAAVDRPVDGVDVDHLEVAVPGGGTVNSDLRVDGRHAPKRKQRLQRRLPPTALVGDGKRIASASRAAVCADPVRDVPSPPATPVVAARRSSQRVSVETAHRPLVFPYQGKVARADAIRGHARHQPRPRCRARRIRRDPRRRSRPRCRGPA